MDYSENVKASAAADLLYAQWYASRSDEQKAEMIASGYDFVAKHIQRQVMAENPFAGQAATIMKFILLTQKEDFSPETFAFIEQKMAERAEREWQERFKTMKKTLGWTYDEMATYMGAENGDSVKSSVNRKLPAFAKLAVCVFEQMSKTQTEP